jgi:hypothetical protein
MSDLVPEKILSLEEIFRVVYNPSAVTPFKEEGAKKMLPVSDFQTKIVRFLPAKTENGGGDLQRQKNVH